MYNTDLSSGLSLPHGRKSLRSLKCYLPSVCHSSVENVLLLYERSGFQSRISLANCLKASTVRYNFFTSLFSMVQVLFCSFTEGQRSS